MNYRLGHLAVLVWAAAPFRMAFAVEDAGQVAPEERKELQASLAEGLRSRDWKLVDLPVKGLLLAEGKERLLEKCVVQAELDAALNLLDPQKRGQLVAWALGARARAGDENARQELQRHARLALDGLFAPGQELVYLHFHALTCLAYLGDAASVDKLKSYVALKVEDLGEEGKNGEFFGKLFLNVQSLLTLAHLKDPQAGVTARTWLPKPKPPEGTPKAEEQGMNNLLFEARNQSTARMERQRTAIEALEILDPKGARVELGQLLVDKNLSPQQRNELFRLMNGGTPPALSNGAGAAKGALLASRPQVIFQRQNIEASPELEKMLKEQLKGMAQNPEFEKMIQEQLKGMDGKTKVVPGEKPPAPPQTQGGEF